MFVLVEFVDSVKIQPHKFRHPLTDVISDKLNKKLANKVYPNIGLCIILYDITKIGELYTFHGDGAIHTKVTFRFIVFRPFIEEIIIGKVHKCSLDGVYVTLGFFEDIIIPPHRLQNPSRFDETEQTWVWEYKTEDGKTHDLFMDIGEPIRFRIIKETYIDVSSVTVTDTVENLGSSRLPPYILHGSMDESGLGLLSWWQNE